MNHINNIINRIFDQDKDKAEKFSRELTAMINKDNITDDDENILHQLSQEFDNLSDNLFEFIGNIVNQNIVFNVPQLSIYLSSDKIDVPCSRLNTYLKCYWHKITYKSGLPREKVWVPIKDFSGNIIIERANVISYQKEDLPYLLIYIIRYLKTMDYHIH
ncbi:hypothetical protein QJ850_gp201 [Acanthamoeba polyphaga mimivirus]|uniref:Uncharacterized protein n=1 Tax=Acanthamoeba polyphaga mimivirus Kroon TaxID=3069720 RepID=A0A0G2Y3Y9_9VIRU|nr:hypothetical protein QJ850_gp201 [Acanthamoeba polyphaga mimivirus]AKI80498.1 hypothetical protein [Acanthamoeba polyphaga mimivirus Kroon]